MICYTYHQIFEVLYGCIIGAVSMFLIILWYEVVKDGN